MPQMNDILFREAMPAGSGRRKPRPALPPENALARTLDCVIVVLMAAIVVTLSLPVGMILVQQSHPVTGYTKPLPQNPPRLRKSPLTGTVIAWYPANETYVYGRLAQR